MSRKLIINLCPTGMVPTKKDNPNVPQSPEEIAECALACAEIGVSIVHIHPRDENGEPAWKKEYFAEIISKIRNKNKDLILCVTTSGRNWNEFEKRSDCLNLEGELIPDMASLTVGSLNFINRESINTPEMIERLATMMKEKGIKPELEVFEPGMVYKTNYLIEKGIISSNSPYFNILLGSLGTSPLDPISFAAMHSLLPKNAVWSLAGIGKYQLDANVLAMAMGGGVRVGLEDNIYMDRNKKELATNIKLVERIVKIAKEMKIEIATAKEAREMLDLRVKK